MNVFRYSRKLVLLGIIIAIVNSSFLIPVYAQPGAKTGSLKIALLPILDALPFYVAEANGYFQKYGVEVIAVPVNSGLERDQLMQSGEIDGMLNEMITTANFNRDRVLVKTVISARKAYPQYPLFRVLSAPGSKLTTVSELVGTPIGISKNTIIEYVTDRLLSAEGIDQEQIVKTSVPIIPERYQLLLQGKLKAAVLPEPLANSAIASGAGEVVDDSKHPQYSVSVLSFNVKTLADKPEAVRLFLKAWMRAADEVNRNAESYRPLLLKKVRVPQNIQTTFRIPPYPHGEVPNARQWADVMNWMVSKGLLSSPLQYEHSITDSYLPQ
jgi:NitT/TauT family transport system substrate-binding protein